MVKVVAREAIAHHHPRLAKRVASIRRKSARVRSMIFFRFVRQEEEAQTRRGKVAAEGEKCQVEKEKDAR